MYTFDSWMEDETNGKKKEERKNAAPALTQ